MHLNFAFTTVQILWTLTFAALLVLLIVLMGRDRTSRFPWFTGSIVLTALSLLVSRLLYGRLPQLTMAAVSIVMADLSAIVALLVLVEMARRAFGRAGRTAWIAATLALLAAGGIVLATWGHWPALSTLKPDSPIAILGFLQFLAEKLGVLGNVIAIGLGLLVVLLGRRYGAGWRSHVQQIMIGLSVAAISQIAVEAIWQIIAKNAAPHSLAEYQRILGLKDKLINTNSTVYIVVAVFWIVCLWFDEPGSAVPAEEAAPVEALTAGTAEPAGPSAQTQP